MIAQAWSALKRLACAVATIAAVQGACGRVMALDPAVSCEIQADERGSAVTLRALIFSKIPVAGSYRLVALKAGAGNRAQVSQGGRFTAAPGRPAQVGIITLAGAGPTEVSLRVSRQGHISECRRRLAGRQ